MLNFVAIRKGTNITPGTSDKDGSPINAQIYPFATLCIVNTKPTLVPAYGTNCIRVLKGIQNTSPHT